MTGTITHVSRVKGHDLFNMTVLEEDGITHVNFLLDDESLKNVIEQFDSPLVRGAKDLINGEILGVWKLPKEGDTQQINERHPLVIDGAPKEITIQRAGKEIVLKEGEKAKAGDLFVYAEETDELRQRYRHQTPPQYSITSKQVNRIVTMLKAEKELADLGITTPSGEVNVSSKTKVGLADGVKAELDGF